jgi:hypothetical protein
MANVLSQVSLLRSKVCNLAFALEVAAFSRLCFQRRDALRGVPAPDGVPSRDALAR